MRGGVGVLRSFNALHSKSAYVMGDREAFPLCARAYRDLLRELHNNEELRERMPVAARVAIYAMFLCGLRIGEAESMQSGWVSSSADGAAVAVPSAVASADGWSPKTAAGTRSVPVPSSMTDHVSGDEMRVEFERVLQAYFVGSDSVSVSRATIRYWLHEAASEAGLEQYREEVERTHGGRGAGDYPDVIAHDGRASWCAQCLRSDVNRYTVRDWGGWSDMSMINRYAKFVGDPGGEQIARF